MYQADIAIVGAGMVGLALARALKDVPVSVVVIDTSNGTTSREGDWMGNLSVRSRATLCQVTRAEYVALGRRPPEWCARPGVREWER